MLSLRASSADRIFSCPGSLVAVPLVPPRREDAEEALEGQMLHYLIAARLVAELGATPPPEGLTPPKTPKGWKLSPFVSWVVDWAVRLVREKVPANWSLMVEVEMEEVYELPRTVYIPASELTEKDFELCGRLVGDESTNPLVPVDRVRIKGHADIIALSPDATEMLGVDWKTGTIGSDPAESSWQAAIYRALAHRSWPSIRSARFIMAQPRIDEEETGVPRVSDDTLDAAAIEANHQEIAERYCAALENRYTTDDGVRQCKYCPVANSDRALECPSLKARNQLMKATLTPEAIEALRQAPDGRKLADHVENIKVLEKPMAAADQALRDWVATHGYADTSSGHRFTITEKGGKFKVKDPVGLLDAVEGLLPDREKRALCLTVGVTALREQVAVLHPDMPKTSAKGASVHSTVAEKIGPFVEQTRVKQLNYT